MTDGAHDVEMRKCVGDREQREADVRDTLVGVRVG